MTPAELQQVRSTPLFAELTDDQVELSSKAAKSSKLPRAPFSPPKASGPAFSIVLLEGEVRVTRTYDRQSILMAVSQARQLSGRNHAAAGHPLAGHCSRLQTRPIVPAQ